MRGVSISIEQLRLLLHFVGVYQFDNKMFPIKGQAQDSDLKVHAHATQHANTHTHTHMHDSAIEALDGFPNNKLLSILDFAYTMECVLGSGAGM